MNKELLDKSQIQLSTIKKTLNRSVTQFSKENLRKEIDKSNSNNLKNIINQDRLISYQFNRSGGTVIAGR